VQEFEVRRPGSRIQERTGNRQALLISCHTGPKELLDFESTAPDKVAILPATRRLTMAAILRETAEQFISLARDKRMRTSVPRWLQVQHFGWTDDARYVHEKHTRTVQKLSQLGEEERVRPLLYKAEPPCHCRISPIP
jgi:hypothetical protein